MLDVGVRYIRICSSTLLSLVIFVGCAYAEAQRVDTGSRPFTVETSIEMSRIRQLDDGGLRRARAGIALFSPDRAHFIVKVSRGDLKRDVNVDSLLLWKTPDVEGALARGAAPGLPARRVLVEKAYTEDWRGISRVKWLNETEVAFIAEAEGGCTQVFAADINAGTISQITHAPTDVVSYAIEGDVVLYFARAAAVRRTVIDATDLPLHELAMEGQSHLGPVELFKASRSEKKASRIGGPAVRVLTDEIWLSPSGQHAVTLVPATSMPEYWSRYVVYFKDRRYTDVSSLDPTSTALLLRARYRLVDLKSGVSRPLLDAPAGFLAYTLTPPMVFWPEASEESVIVSHTYLPLIGEGGERNARGPAIAEVSLKDGRARVIEWEPMSTYDDALKGAGSRERILSLRWDGGRQTITIDRVTASGSRVTNAYRRDDRGWTRAPSGEVQSVRLFNVEVKQSLQDRPKLYAIDSSSSRSVELLDPAPELAQVTLGRMSKVSWLDGKRREWHAGVVYPVGYDPKRRYPLVVQTHGFNENEFLFDGPSHTTTAFAAQALANVGIMVLQVAEGRSGAVSGDQREAYDVASGLKAGIDKMISDGLADPSKVGLIGWSRTGYHAIGLLAYFPDALAAVSISDAVQYGYAQLLMTSNNDDIREIERVTGGLPIAVGYGKWFDSNPLYRITDTKAAIRIEAIGEPYSMWETVAVLRMAGKSVDLLYFPQGSHVLSKPSERMASQGRTVDWFRFWLQGYEDPDPRKADMYARWRQF